MRISLGLIAALLCLIAGGAQAMDVETLVAKHIEARGGLERLKALQSLRLKGKLQFSGGFFSAELGYTELIKRGGQYRTESTLQGLTGVSAWDGKEGWQVQPFRGRRDPDRLPAEEAKPLAQAADIDGPLVDAARKGHRVEYLGTEDVDGTEAHKLKVTLADGDTQFVYLDPDWFLTIRVVTRTKVRGAERELEIDYGSYEQVAGVYLPFSVEIGPAGGSKFQKITFEAAEANVSLDDALFRFPTPPQAAQQR